MRIDARQLTLLDKKPLSLDATFWQGSFNARESSLHQLAPYVGKLKSGMVRVLLELYSKKGDTVLDPFCGSGTVPFEAILLSRNTIANDLSPYACVITKGKLSSPRHKHEALIQAKELCDAVDKLAPSIPIDTVPSWIAHFFHPDTLREVVAAFSILKEWKNYFLTACLLGILHHVRPGFLSYPASHLTPYLRLKKYPPEQHPHMYQYRDLMSRLLAKVERAYIHTYFDADMDKASYQVYQQNAMNLPIPGQSVDAIISSPPYFGALDYARDNRLRLWFLGVDDWKQLDRQLTASGRVYIAQMSKCLAEMDRVLRPGKYCVLILGDVEHNGKTKHTAQIISELAQEMTDGRLRTEMIYKDEIPDIRRSRRRTHTTKWERILVMHKES